MPDRQGDEHAPERLFLRLVEVLQQAFAVLRQHTLGGAEERDTFEIFRREGEQVALVDDDLPLEQCRGRLVAERFDVERSPARDVEDPLAQLRRARPRVGAAQVDVALLRRGEGGTAFGALRGHLEGVLGTVAQVDDRAEHFRDHVAGLADDHGVADEHALARHLGRVVQRRQRDGGPGDGDRLHVGEGGHASGAPDADADVEELGGDLLRRVLVGDRPPRGAGRGTETAVQPHVVDLDHQAVDLVFDVVAVFAPVAHPLDDRLGALHANGVWGDGQAPGREGRVGVGLRAGLEALHAAVAVAVHAQTPARRDGRVLLPEGTGGGIAGIREGRLALGHQPGVESLEVLEPEEHLATHFEQRRNRVFVGTGELFGNVVDRAGVEGDVLPGTPVAAGGRADEFAVLVDEAERHAVDLHLAQIVGVGAGLGLGAREPRAQFVLVEDVVEAEHAFEMLDGTELGGEAAADQLGGRIRRAEFGVLLLECLQFAEERVELTVGDDGASRT